MFYYFNDKAAVDHAKKHDLPKPQINSTLDLNKGLMLTGQYGVGKTTLLRALFEVPWGNVSKEEFIFGKTKRISCINIVNEYSRDRETFWKYVKDDWLFDDLGREPSPMYAKASDLPFFTQLIETRYNSDQPLKTYYTTNLSMEDITDKYSSRIDSILHETCNIVEMTGEDFRKK